MHDAWHIIKWIGVAVTFAYIIVQVFAIRRLKGSQKKRSNAVLAVFLVVMFGSDLIRNVFFFENRMANRVGMVVTAVAALGAMFVLARMFGETPSVASDNRQGAEQYIQPMKLS